MAQPIPDHTNHSLQKFLAARNIPSETPLDLVSHRAGRAVLHFHHDGLDYTLKCFDTQKEDLSEEYHREQQFYSFLKPLQTGRTPLLLDDDSQGQILLLSRITGRGLRESELNRQAVLQATDFIAAINQDVEAARNQISPALGACQAINEHLSAVSNLVTSIQQHQTLVNPQTQTFIEAELGPVWQKVLGNILAQFQTASIDIETPLENTSLMLSPGEFGFHNAVLTPDKEICFVDFDQAGWDDPARVICRFFTLGPNPPKEDHWDLVIEKIGELENIDPFCGIKARLLLPAYQIARACSPILTCLQEEARPLSDAESDTATHSTTKLINVTNRSRQWLIRANQGV